MLLCLDARRGTNIVVSAQVLSTSQTDNTVFWHENDGTQSFVERTITTTAGNAYSTFSIDMDGDSGRPVSES